MKENLWKEVAGKIIFRPSIVLAIRLDTPSSVNKEFIGYQRAAGKVVDAEESPKTLLLTDENVFLLSLSVEAVRRSVAQT